jgi:Phage tail lysozyme
MPKSILEIEVNDEQFRSYLATFNRYQEQMKQMPGPWKETGEETAAVAVSIAAMTTALDLHYDKVRRLAELEKEEAEARKKADEEHKRRLEEESDIEKDNEARRRKTITQTKEIAKNVADTAMSLGKWAVGGGLAGLVGGALGLWGLDKFVEDIGRERRLAQGFGVSTGERQALSIQMSRYFDVNSNLENIAEAQADPSKRWAFSAMGVNPTGKDPAQLALEMATRARTIFMAGRGNEQYAQAHGLLNFYSMDELRRLQMTKPGDLAASVAATRKDIGLGLSDKNSKMWQDFVIKVEEAGRTIENAFITKLSALNDSGALTKLTTDLTKLAVDVIEKIDFVKLGQGLTTLANYLGSKEFQDDFKTFVDNAAYAAKRMYEVAKWLGLLPGTDSDKGAQAQKQLAEDQRNWDAWAKSNNMVYGSIAGPLITKAEFGARPTMASLAASDPYYAKGAAYDTRGEAVGGKLGERMGYMARTMMKYGWSAEQTAGILSNVQAEDAPLDPFAVGDKGTAYGIAQWHAPRQAEYATRYGHTMQSVTDIQQALDEQMDFINYELTQGKYKQAGTDLRRIFSAGAAGHEMSLEYEGPKAGESAAQARGKQAERLVITIRNLGNPIGATVNAAGR